MLVESLSSLIEVWSEVCDSSNYPFGHVHKENVKSKFASFTHFRKKQTQTKQDQKFDLKKSRLQMIWWFLCKKRDRKICLLFLRLWQVQQTSLFTIHTFSPYISNKTKIFQNMMYEKRQKEAENRNYGFLLTLMWCQNIWGSAVCSGLQLNFKNSKKKKK